MKVCYTVNFGSYDELRPPTVITPGWTYICITDSMEPVPAPYIAARVSVDMFCGDIKLASRKMKITDVLHGYTVSVYHDANIQVKCNLNELVERYHKTDLTVMKHPTRKTWQEEAEACVSFGLVEQEKIDLLQKYIDLFLIPSSEPITPLAACGVIIRSNSTRVIVFQAAWFRLVDRFSTRDQLTFNFAANQSGINFGYMPYSVLEDNEFKWHPHLAK